MTAVLTRDPGAAIESLSLRLREARVEALGVLTAPTERPKGELTAGMTRPAVDLDLWTLHVRYARHRDERARDKLVQHYRPYAESLARNFYRNGESLEDLTQIAYEGLLVALQRFEPSRRRPFLAYAKPTIIGLIKRHFRDAGWSVRIPRRAHELAGPIRDVRDMLAQDLGREPTDAEVADFLGVSEDDLRSVLSAEDSRQARSLNTVDPVTKLQMDQVVGQEDPWLDVMENHTALAQAMESLSVESRDLLWCYFVEEKTQAELGEELGCSQMQVSRLLAGAIRQLRARMVGS